MSTTWENMELPEGRRLVRDDLYGFLKVMPRPSDEELASYYADTYRNPCIPYDPEGQAESFAISYQGRDVCLTSDVGRASCWRHSCIAAGTRSG